MLDNKIYNLMNQLVEEHKSLWRIKNHYQNESGNCVDCKDFWKKMEEDKESHIDELLNLIREHLD